MKYPQLNSLVPNGEHFDESAMNEGIWLTTSHVDAIENKIADLEVVISDNSIHLQQLSDDKTAAITAKENSDNDLKAAQDKNVILAQKVSDLEAKIQELGDKPSGTGTTLTAQADSETGNGGKKVPSYLDENNPINQFADKRLGKK